MVKTFKRLSITLLVLIFVGCNNSSQSDNTQDAQIKSAVFANPSFASTAQEVEAKLSNFTTRSQELADKIKSSYAPNFEDDLLPLYELLVDLNNATAYNTQLMNRSPIPEVRALAFLGYVEYPKLSSDLKRDEQLKTIVQNILNDFNPISSKQKKVVQYFSQYFVDTATNPQQDLIYEADENLTNLSLEYYNNAISLSAWDKFTSTEFACLSEDILSHIPTDSSGDFIFDATNSIYSTLLHSCLDDATREKVSSVYNSKAATQNSLLWPEIAEYRLTLAKLQEFDDFASLRLENTILRSEQNIRDLFENVDTITSPAFEKIKEYYKDIQEDETGIREDTVSAWNRYRHYFTLKSKFYDNVEQNLKVFTFPETFDRMLYLMGKILGLTFVKTQNSENFWNPDVIEYLVYDKDTNNPVGTLLVDPYAIDGTDNIPSASVLMGSHLLDSEQITQEVVVLNLNIEKSTSDTTYFTSATYRALGHELGHTLHFLLMDSEIESYKSDFVEIPSMFSELLVADPEFFKALLSPDPDVPLEELSDEFVTYWNYYRESALDIVERERLILSMSATALDLTSWQGDGSNNIAEIAKSNLAKYFYHYPSSSQPFYDSSYFINPTTDARYYQYLLANVISKDILSVFNTSSRSIFDQELGKKYRYHILQNCGPDTESSINNFLGKEWSYDSYKDWYDEKTSVLFE